MTTPLKFGGGIRENVRIYPFAEHDYPILGLFTFEQITKWKQQWRESERGQWLISKYYEVLVTYSISQDQKFVRFYLKVVAEEFDEANITFYNLL